MKKNTYSFDMDKWSKEKKKKAEKPVKEKKEKETPLKMGAPDTFKIEKFEKKTKKEKIEKTIKEDKGIKLDFKPKKDKIFHKESTLKKAKEQNINVTENFVIVDDCKKKKKTFDENTKKKFIVLLTIALALIFAIIGTIIVVNFLNETVSIIVSRPPTKTEYYVGEEPDYSGVVIGLVKRNGKIDFIQYETDPTGFTFSGYDGSVANERQAIKVNYKGFSANCFVEIIEIPTPTPVLVGITLETMPKTEYKLGEKLDTSTGIILCEYKDGSVFRIHLRNSHVSGFSKIDGPGVYQLTVKYKEGGILATTTYTITVTE